jgi:hypothetical protein
MLSLFSLRPDQRLHRETPGGPSGGDPAGDPPGQPTYDEWLAEPLNVRYTKKLRDEAAGARVKARDQASELARKLGVETPDGSPPLSVDELVEKLKPLRESGDTIRSLKLRASLAEAFHAKGLKPGITRAALLDQGHMDRLTKAVDAPDFDEQLDTTLGELVESMPEVKDAGRGVGARGTEFKPNPHPYEGQLTLEEVSAMQPEEVLKAQQSGLLDRLLGRRS